MPLPERDPGRKAAMMRRVLALVASLTSTFVVTASTAAADTIQVTSGVIDTAFGPVSGPWDAKNLILVGQDLHVGSALEDEIAFVQLSAVPRVVSGASIDLSGELRVEDQLGGTVNGAAGILNAPLELWFHASPATVACTGIESQMQCSASAPFTLTADIAFTPFGQTPFTQRLVGRGTATGSLFRVGSYEAGKVEYRLDPSPVPEPGTLSLLLAGAMTMGAGVWRRRQLPDVRAS
jgi:hypothetical protein